MLYQQAFFLIVTSHLFLLYVGVCVFACVPFYAFTPHNKLVLRQKQMVLKNRHWQLAHGSQQRDLGRQPSDTLVQASGTLAILGGGPLGCAGGPRGLCKGSTAVGQRVADVLQSGSTCSSRLRAESTSFLENSPSYQLLYSITVSDLSPTLAGQVMAIGCTDVLSLQLKSLQEGHVTY